MIEMGIEAIARDRLHGAGYLARKALGVLALAPGPERAAVGRRLATLRPEMPAIANAVREALADGDVRRVIRRGDAERRRVARSAMRALARRRVATISNSSLVARALVYAAPAEVQVVVGGPDDEGHRLVRDLVTAGVRAAALPLERVDAEIAVVGCDAVFEDGGFVNRRGTRELVTRIPALVLVDRWKHVPGPAPASWPDPERFEVVPGGELRAPA